MGDASSFHWFKSRLLSVASARHYIGVNRVRVISHCEFAVADHDSREAETPNLMVHFGVRHYIAVAV